MRTASCLVVVPALLLLAPGCAHPGEIAAVPASSAAGVSFGAASDDGQAEAAHVSSESAAFTQKSGDFVTYRISGGFRKTPLLLTQRVVDASEMELVMDLTLDEGAHKTNIRAHYTHEPGAAHELVSASRLDASGAEKPMPLAELDALMAKTALAADDNQGPFDSERVTVSVGGQSIACTRTSYHVVVGKQRATMSALTSDTFPWGDVGGEIKSEQGRVLYRAEVVDMGGAHPFVTASR